MNDEKYEIEKLDSLDFHEIQVHILRQLGYRNQKTFSEVQGEWDSSKVSFHVNKLVEKGLIEKSDKKYHVTPRGKGILADIKYNKYRAPINLMNLLIFSPDGKVYLEYCGDAMDPLAESYRPLMSRILKGEELEEKAKKLFMDKFGYKPDNVKKAGVLENLLKFKEGFSQGYIVHTLYIESQEDNTNFYSPQQMDDLKLIPGMDKIVKRVSDKEDLPFMGRWDHVEESGFELEKLDF